VGVLPDLAVPGLVAAGATWLLVRHAAARRDDRAASLVLAVGFGTLLAGIVLQLLLTARGPVPFPSVADVGLLTPYPCLLVALLVGLRRELRGVRLIVALDGLSGTLAGGAVATWTIGSLIDTTDGVGLGTATLLAYPACAAVVVAATVGAVGIVGRRQGDGFLVTALGILLFAAGDVVHATRLASDVPRFGTWVDLVWAAGLVLVAVGATRTRPSGTRALPGAGSLVVVAIASLSTIAVLAAAPPLGQPSLARELSLAALATCAVRLVLAFLQLRELAAIRELALTDELTGAANRRALYSALDVTFARRTEDQRGFALALIDLDHFKEVNDSFGHAVGDELLQAVVGRFEDALRQLQTPYLFSRLGGDEFAVMLPDVDSEDAAMACGSALFESLADPVELRDVVLHAQASIGIATAPLHGANRGDILFAADAAMYAAKTSGEPVCFHSPSAVGDRRQRLFVAEDLYAALERDELTVDYQPILTVDGTLVAAEALVRWDHPTRGRLLPGDFLEAAERYKLTPGIAERVLDVALGDLARWRAGGAMIGASVNVSASDLRDEGLVRIVAAALITHQVPAEALTIEITETAMMRDPELARTVMTTLSELGVRLSVDDYGTGYSSLEYLLKLPISELKLDRAFCADIVTEGRATAIVRSTVGLTHALGLRMVAEGVEDAGTLFMLRELGCDLVQGWHTGRPGPAAAFDELVAAQLQGSPEPSA
jgi:diguanylate cyclase (GGDEF)-like protein